MSLKVDIKVEEIKNSGWTVLKMDIKVKETKKIRWTVLKMDTNKEKRLTCPKKGTSNSKETNKNNNRNK